MNAIGNKGSKGYRQIADLIGDHSIVAEVGVLGDGLKATFTNVGTIDSFSTRDVVLYTPGKERLSVIVTQGDFPGGTQVRTTVGTQTFIYQGRQPDFVTMYHELVGETLKYRRGQLHLQNDLVLDSQTVIKIENEIRQFHGMSPRTGADHGMTVITVEAGVP